MFDLGSWVIGLLAESGRKKLTVAVFGTEQERALRSAATAAVQSTARELRPADEKQAEDLARVIDHVFDKPVSEVVFAEHRTMLEALRAGITAQLAVLDDAMLTGQGQSAAEALGIGATVVAETLTTHLEREIITRASRGGALAPLAAQLNHDVTHLQEQQTYAAVCQLGVVIQDAINRPESSSHASAQPPRLAISGTDVALHVDQLLDGLEIGGHEEAERRVNRLFLPLYRGQQRAAIEAVIQVATTTTDGTTQILACSLIEAADRLDPMLITTDEVEDLARSANFSVRSTAAVLLWQWAISIPGRVPVPLLGRLTKPSAEDWYVHAPARAGAKQLLLVRSSARAIFDRMAASHDRDDRHYAVGDLLEVAKIEPRVVPADLAEKLVRDEDKAVAARAATLLRAVKAVEKEARGNHGQFGL